MAIGYDSFHLSRADGVLLAGGRSVFAACDRGLSADAVLSDAGLRPGGPQIIDAAARVSLNIWRK